jgi:two-component system response regulator HydG
MPMPGEGMRVLVVDDRSEMAEMIAEDLSDRGFDARAVTSGREALNLLRSEHIDALVTDLRMPEVDGLTLLRTSIELDPSRPVIMMTAYGSLETALEAVKGGTWQYLTKPFRVEVLARLLEAALSLRHAR